MQLEKEILNLGVLDFNGVLVSNVECPDILKHEIRPDIITVVINWQLAKRRSGTHHTKGRSDIVKSRRKINAQKGGGRARHGAASAPQFRGGGVVFGPKFRDHEYSINKKVRKFALKSALSCRLFERNLLLIDSLKIDSPKTSLFVDKLDSFKEALLKINSHYADFVKGYKVLFVDSLVDENLKRATSNLHNVNILPVCGLNVYDIFKHHLIIISKDGLEALKTRLIS